MLDQLNDNIPQHVAIIMDGNGRWAKRQGLMRVVGHESGAQAVRESLKASLEIGVKYLTLYAFSTENWNRPKREVNALMSLLVKSLKKELPELKKGKIRLNVVGKTSDLPEKVQKELAYVIQETQEFDDLVLTLALSYGSREELVKTVKEIADKVKNNLISQESINEQLIEQHLYTNCLLYTSDAADD